MAQAAVDGIAGKDPEEKAQDGTEGVHQAAAAVDDRSQPRQKKQKKKKRKYVMAFSLATNEESRQLHSFRACVGWSISLIIVGYDDQGAPEVVLPIILPHFACVLSMTDLI